MSRKTNNITPDPTGKSNIRSIDVYRRLRNARRTGPTTEPLRPGHAPVNNVESRLNRIMDEIEKIIETIVDMESRVDYNDRLVQLIIKHLNERTSPNQ